VARVVCQVVRRADRVTFLWSNGTASFEPYHLDGTEREQFDRIAGQAREQLAAAATGAETDLAQVGYQLYRAAFRLDSPEGAAAQEIGHWLGEQLGHGRVEAIEFLTDSPGHIPWNVLRDTAPQAGGEDFWGLRFGLGAGRRTNPLRFAPSLVNPAVLLAADVGVLDALPGELRGQFDQGGEDRLILDSPEPLASHLRRRTPDLLLLLARVDGDGLRIGSQRVTPAELREWIGESREGNPDPVVFVAGIGTPEQTAAWPGWLAAASAGLDGLVTNEVPLPPPEAARALSAFAERLTTGRGTLGAALTEARRGLAPAGLALTAFCPPGMRLGEEATEPAPELPRLPLPDYPYRPLQAYGPEDRPLFVGRDEETLRLAALLDDAGTSAVLLHGGPAVGKTSLVQAGLVPYLELECVGYRVLCDRTPEGTETPAEEDAPPLLLRAGNDLAGQIADGLFAFCSRPLTYTTPAGQAVTVDLPAILGAYLGGGAPASTAIQPPPQGAGIIEPGHAPPPEPEPDAGPEPRDLWLTLREDPDRLGRLLDDVTRRLPYELVIAIDQGEELLTLVRSPTERERRQQALAMLASLAASAARCKVVLVVRTEYAGQLAGLLPAGPGRDRFADFFLEELGAAAMADAVLAPTSRDEIPYADGVPHERYHFSYEEGLAQQIVSEVIAESRAEQVGALALLQTVCATLYDRRVLQKKQDMIRAADLKDVGGVRGALARYVGQKVKDLPLPSGARDGLRALIGVLYTRHRDGTITRDLAPARDLQAAWKGTVPVEQAVNTAAEQAGLFTIDELLVAGQPGLYVSLSQDAVAQAARQWDDDTRRGAAGRSKVIDTLWIMIPLALLAVAATYAGTRLYYAPALEQETKVREEIQAQAVKALGELEANLLPHYRGQLASAEEALATGNALAARQFLLSQPAVPIEPKNEIRGFEWAYLWNRAVGSRHTFESHLGTVNAVAVAPDGRLAASAADDGTVRLWDLGRGLIAALIPAGKSAVRAVAFSPDGKTVAAAGADKVVRLWDVSGVKDEYVVLDQPPRELRGHEDTVLALAFDKTGATLASGGADKAVILWDVKAEKARATLKEHGAAVQALAFTSDGKTLASGAAEPGVILWDVDAGKKSAAFKSEQDTVSALAFAPDGKRLAVGGMTRRTGIDAGTAVVLDAAKGTAAGPRLEHGQGVLALAYGPGGKSIASAGKDNVIRLWDADAGHEVGRWVGHLGWVTAVAFTAEGTTLVSGGYDRMVKAWDVGQDPAAQVLRGHKGWVHSLAFSGGKGKEPAILASGGDDGLVKLWDPGTGTPLGELAGHAGAVTAVVFSPTKPLLLAVGSWGEKGEGEIKLWQLSREEKAATYKGKELHTLKGHKGGVTCLSFSPEDRLASGSADKTVIIWNTQTGKAEKTLTGTSAFRSVSYFPDGGLLMAGEAGGLVRVWDADKGQPFVEPFAAHTDAVEAVDWILLQGQSRPVPAPLTAGRDGLVRVWGVSGKSATFEPLATSRAAGQPITCLYRRGRTMFTAGWDGTVRVWEVGLRAVRTAEGVKGVVEVQERFTLAGHTGPIRAVVLSPDQSVLASAGHDGTVRLWRAAARAAPAAKAK
jgi:WD40 repeat protein